MRKLILSAGCAVALAGCISTTASDPLTSFLTGLANKVTADLQVAVNTASTPVTDVNGTHPVDPAGVTCGQTLLAVQANVNAVLKAANAAGSGAVTAAELGSLMVPGTPQTNAVRDQIVQGCALKVAQVTNAIAGGAVWFSALAQAFQIAAPLAAAAPLG